MSEHAITTIVTGIVNIVTLIVGLITVMVKIKAGNRNTQALADRTELVEQKLDDTTVKTKSALEKSNKIMQEQLSTVLTEVRSVKSLIKSPE